jgi:hypothetical protein
MQAASRGYPVSALQPVWAAAALEPAGRDRATPPRVDDELFAAIGERASV